MTTNLLNSFYFNSNIIWTFCSRHNNGHVTKSQFRQCLTMLELHCTEPEMIALEAKFCNDTGFNYLAFLAELQPVEPQQFMYETRLEDIRQTNVRKTLPELKPQKDLESVLLKVKTKVHIRKMVLYLSNPVKSIFIKTIWYIYVLI